MVYIFCCILKKKSYIWRRFKIIRFIKYKFIMKKKNLLKKFKKRYHSFCMWLAGCLLLLILWLISETNGNISVFPQVTAQALSSENLVLAAFAGIMLIMSELDLTSHRVCWKFHASYYLITVLLYYIAAVLWVRDWNWCMAVPAGIYLWRILLPFRWMRELNTFLASMHY